MPGPGYETENKQEESRNLNSQQESQGGGNLNANLVQMEQNTALSGGGGLLSNSDNEFQTEASQNINGNNNEESLAPVNEIASGEFAGGGDGNAGGFTPPPSGGGVPPERELLPQDERQPEQFFLADEEEEQIEEAQEQEQGIEESRLPAGSAQVEEIEPFDLAGGEMDKDTASGDDPNEGGRNSGVGADTGGSSNHPTLHQKFILAEFLHMVDQQHPHPITEAEAIAKIEAYKNELLAKKGNKEYRKYSRKVKKQLKAFEKAKSQDGIKWGTKACANMFYEYFPELTPTITITEIPPISLKDYLQQEQEKAEKEFFNRPIDNIPAPPIRDRLEPKSIGGYTGKDYEGILRVCWTIDDGPVPAYTSEMKSESLKGIAPTTWFIQYNKLLDDINKGGKSLSVLQKVVQEGGEIALHGVHPEDSHAAWFPFEGKGAYHFPYKNTPQEEIVSAIIQFKDFLERPDLKLGKIRFVRPPGGLVSEIYRYLEAKTNLDRDQLWEVAKGIIDNVSPQTWEKKYPSVLEEIKEVSNNYTILMSGLAKAGLILWGGDSNKLILNSYDDLQIDSSYVSWQSSSKTGDSIDNENNPLKLTSDTKKDLEENNFTQNFNGILESTIDNEFYNLVILTHENKIPQKEINYLEEAKKDRKSMERLAQQSRVRLEYYTMSELLSLSLGGVDLDELKITYE